jgi:hypothetical protein
MGAKSPMQSFMSQTVDEMNLVQRGRFHDRRRSEPRILCERAISLVPCAQAESSRYLKAHLTDCSLHGLGLLLPEKIEGGQQIIVKSDLDDPLSLPIYTIRYCIQTQPAQFRAGAKFTGFAAVKFRGELPALLASLTGSQTR